MWWLMRRVRGGAAERGAVAALVAILLTTGVLVGMGAIVVDAGQIYSARAQMQNAADAAALKIAQACAATPVGPACKTNPGDPTTSGYAAANPYAANNAIDGNSHISAVCGSGAPALSTTCPSDKASLYCPNGGTGNFVEVHTQTGADSTKTLLPPAFGRALLGNSYNGKVVGACAQVSWGPLGGVDNGLAVTLSLCEWNIGTGYVNTYAKAPPYPPNWPPGPRYPLDSVKNVNPVPAGAAGGEQVIALHGSGGSSCADHPGVAGYDMPGDFGWLPTNPSPPNPQCASTIDLVTGIYNPSSGVGAPTGCKAALIAAMGNPAAAVWPTVVYLPVYKNPASGGVYHLQGFAAFIVTGYSLPGDGSAGPKSSASSISGKDYCGGNTDCIYGYFIAGLVGVPGKIAPSGTPNLGPSNVQLTG